VYDEVMQISVLGDWGVILSDLPAPSYAIAEWVLDLKLAGLTDAVPTEEEVGLYFEPGTDLGNLELPDYSAHAASAKAAKHHRIPVCFNGADLDEVGQEVARELLCATVRVAFIGFSPGFAYMKGLPGRLAELHRRSVPRSSVPRGSVAVAGGYVAVYPSSCAGGWNLLGTTPVKIVDVDSDFYLFQPGDTVEFFEIAEAELDRWV
jgi:allophanate hydrolase subunit 1